MSTTEPSAPTRNMLEDEMSVTETATVPTILRREADRMRDLVLTDQNLDNEKKIVTEELRLRTENDPMARLLVQAQRALLGDHGFEIVELTGLHLELLLNWLSPLPKLDRLQRSWNRSWAVPLMRALLAAGALAPRYALDLVFVARRG